MKTESIALWNIRPSRWQPREPQFDAESLTELAQSIHEHGLIHAILVFGCPDEDGYTVWELIAGERRARATIALELAELFPQHTLAEWCTRLANVGLAGLGEEERAALKTAQATIPAQVYPAGDLKVLHLLAVIENLDRADLSPIEEARAYKGLLDEYGWSQRELAAHVNKSQGYIAQRLAILGLPQSAQEAVSTRVLSFSHARALAAVPEALQESMTAWTVAAVQQDNNPLTSRQVENRLRQVAAFVDPARWEPNGETIYTPEQRNRLRVIRGILQSEGDDIAKRTDAILLLAESGYSKTNLLNVRPIEVVSDRVHTSMVIAALSGSELDEDKRIETAGMLCHNCVWVQAWGELSAYPNLPIPCARIEHPTARACSNYIGPVDPVVIPLYSWDLRREAERIEGVTLITEPFLHLTSVEEFITLYRHTATFRMNQDDTHEQAVARKHIEKIREYYEWQRDLPDAWRAHFQAHACEKCVHYAPSLIEQGDPPCALVVNPLEKREYGKMTYCAPEFGCLVQSTGQLAPRCEAFAYRELPGFAFPEYMLINLPARSRVLAWLEAIAGQAKSNYTNHVLWGSFSWLNYGRTMGHTAVDWPAFKKWLGAHWDELGDAAVAHLIDVAVSELELFRHVDTEFALLNATDTQPEIWRRLTFPFSYYQEHTYSIPPHWPEDWPKPWEGESRIREMND